MNYAGISNNHIPDVEFAQHLLHSKQHPVGISVLFYPKIKSTFSRKEFQIEFSGKKNQTKLNYKPLNNKLSKTMLLKTVLYLKDSKSRYKT